MADTSIQTSSRAPANLVGWLWGKLGDVLDGPFRAVQRHIGANRMAYVFLAPNVLVFGLFSFWPMLLNFYIAFTGGQSVILAERPFVGLDNFRELLDCPSWLDPRTCPVAGFSFWTGVWNTLFFAVVQVPIMIVVALVTALILNRDIRARGFWRAVYFYPVMLSPVVVAVIWDWILKRRGILNALLSDGVDGWNAFAGSNLFVPMLAGFSALAAWAFCRRLLRDWPVWLKLVGTGLGALIMAFILVFLYLRCYNL
jgi:ABC-type sugar transport system permease subunit